MVTEEELDLGLDGLEEALTVLWEDLTGTVEIIDDKLGISPVIDAVAQVTGEVLVSGTIITLSLPEYLMDSIAQKMFPVTDPFLIPIREGRLYPDGSPMDESPALVRFTGQWGSFWHWGGTELPTSVLFTSKGGLMTETLKPVSFQSIGGIFETAMLVTFTEVVG